MARTYAPKTVRTSDDRLTLALRDYPPVAADSDALPLLLLHGLTRNAADFEPLVEHLPAHRLIVPDQRGRGASERDPIAANYRVDVYAADMLALMDALGIDQVAVIGTSMGGLIGMVMAAIAPDRIAALVVNDVGPVIETQGLDRIRGYVGPSAAAADWIAMAQRVAASNRDAFPDFGDADWQAFARRIAREGEGGIVADYDPAIAEGLRVEPTTAEGAGAVVPPDLWPLWDTLAQMPTLVIRGALSDLLAASTVAEMARRHAGPFAAVDVARRGHAPLLDEPEVLAALPSFVAKYAAQPAVSAGQAAE